MGQSIAILDIGSSKITAIIGEQGINGTPNVLGVGECEYSGYSNAKFYESDKILSAVCRAIELAEQDANIPIKSLCIGVPGEFTTSVCKEVSVNMTKKRKIIDEDVNYLHNQGDKFDSKNHRTINIAPIYYLLDNNQVLLNPIGKNSQKLSGKISYTLALKEFIDFFDDIMNKIQIRSYDYCSSLLAEVLYLFSEEKRDESLLLIDVGFLSTSIAYVRGDGIVSQASFSTGSAYILGDLVKYLNLPYEIAQKIARKIILTLETNNEDVYEVAGKNGNILSYSATQVNQIAIERMKAIVVSIDKVISNWHLPRSLSFYLTGEGLTHIKGAQDYMSKFFNKNVLFVKPDIPKYDKTYLFRQLGLLYMVLEQNSRPIKPKGLFSLFLK